MAARINQNRQRPVVPNPQLASNLSNQAQHDGWQDFLLFTRVLKRLANGLTLTPQEIELVGSFANICYGLSKQAFRSFRAELLDGKDSANADSTNIYNELHQAINLLNFYKFYEQVNKKNPCRTIITFDLSKIPSEDNSFSVDSNLLLSILRNLCKNADEAVGQPNVIDPKIHLDAWIESPQGLPRRLHVKMTNSGSFHENFLKYAGTTMQSTKIGTQDLCGYGLVSMANKIRAHGGDIKQPLVLRNTRNPATGEPMVEVSFYIEEMDGDRPKYPVELQPTGA